MGKKFQSNWLVKSANSPWHLIFLIYFKRKRDFTQTLHLNQTGSYLHVLKKINEPKTPQADSSDKKQVGRMLDKKWLTVYSRILWWEIAISILFDTLLGGGRGRKKNGWL